MTAALDRLAPEGALGIAVSGGGDSTALVLIARDWARARARRLVLATVDHGLRVEARREAEAVGRLATELDLPHMILTITEDLRAAGGNLPAAARAARYGALAEWARTGELSAVALGHTRDDQAETVLLRLARGSGVEGLSAMAETSTRLGMIWLRPMLGVERASLRDLLKARGVSWSEDPGNDDLAQDRIKARKALAHLAPLGITVEGLAATATRLRRQRQVLEADLVRLATLTARAEAGAIRLARGPLWRGMEDSRLRLVAWALGAVSGRPYRPRFEALSRLVGAVEAPGSGRATLSGCVVAWGRGPDADILICREPARAEEKRLRPGVVDWDNRWRLDCPEGLPQGLSLGPLGACVGRELATVLDRLDPEDARPWHGLDRDIRAVLPAIRDDQGRLRAVGRADGAGLTVISPDLGISYEDKVALELHHLVASS